jgi:hypothetical protein
MMASLESFNREGVKEYNDYYDLFFVVCLAWSTTFIWPGMVGF